MRITESEALELLNTHNHGVLGTLHPDRGVDLTPIVYATDFDSSDGSGDASNGDRGKDRGYLGSPVDLVKLKSSLRLQRQRNLDHDARASVLIEGWDRNDWSKLWWVRAELVWVGPDGAGRADVLADRLASAYTQYADKPFATVLVFEIMGATGWSQSKGALS